MKYLWGHNKPYNDFSSYFKRLFKERIQKIAINAGFTCPNRDGTKGTDGCSYCNNNAFIPFYCSSLKSIREQLNMGISFFSKKYKTQKYLAYFQAYSNTYAYFSVLKKSYEEALSIPGIAGLVIATRPDCINEKILDYLQKLAEQYYIVLEYGIESCNNKTLLNINRGHTFEESINALEISKNRGLHIGIHYIIGLPGDSRKDNLEHAKILSDLPFETLKLHQLQIIKNTQMAKEYIQNPEKFDLFSLEEYIDFVVQFSERLSPNIVIERFTSEVPKKLLIAPQWGEVKNFEITEKIIKKFKEKNTWQGRLYKK